MNFFRPKELPMAQSRPTPWFRQEWRKFFAFRMPPPLFRQEWRKFFSFRMPFRGFVKSDGSSVVSSRVTEILWISNAIPWFRQGPDCLVRRKGSLNVQQAFTRTLTFRSSKIPLIFFDLFDLLEFLCEICKCTLLSTCGCPNYKHAALPLQSLFKFEVKWCHHCKLCDKNADIQEN